MRLSGQPLRKRKAQASAEFIIIAILLLSAISVISITSLVKTREIEIFNLQREAENVLQEAGSAINTAYLEGDGFSTNVTLPASILGANYTISVSSSFLSLNVHDTSFQKTLLTDIISGQPSPGSNAIENVDGEVSIT